MRSVTSYFNRSHLCLYPFLTPPPDLACMHVCVKLCVYIYIYLGGLCIGSFLISMEGMKGITSSTNLSQNANQVIRGREHMACGTEITGRFTILRNLWFLRVPPGLHSVWPHLGRDGVLRKLATPARQLARMSSICAPVARFEQQLSELRAHNFTEV